MVVQPDRGGGDEVTLGEVNRNITKVGQDLAAFMAEARENYVRKDVADERWQLADIQRVAVELRVRSLENAQAWLVRLIIGAVVLAVLGGLFAASKVAG